MQDERDWHALLRERIEEHITTAAGKNPPAEEAHYVVRARTRLTVDGIQQARIQVGARNSDNFCGARPGQLELKGITNTDAVDSEGRHEATYEFRLHVPAPTRPVTAKRWPFGELP